jgi:hypothetical protein
VSAPARPPSGRLSKPAVSDGEKVTHVADQTVQVRVLGNGFELRRGLLLGGGGLLGAASLLGLAGMALISSAVLTAGRRWVETLETPPREVARRTLRQTRAAVTAGAVAGAAAWRDNPGAPSSN